MATNGKAWAHGSASHPARVLRNMVAAIFGVPMAAHSNSVTPATTRAGYGVVGGGDLLVTSTGTTNWSCAPGYVIGVGTFATAQGTYVGYNDAARTGSMTRDATNPRINLVAYRVRDTDEDATGAEDDDIVVITGTPAGSPTVPSIPSSLGTLVVLAEVLVPSSASGAALTYTDRRPFATALGGLHRCTSSTNPSGAAAWEGRAIYETDTDRILIHNGTSFVPFGELGAWRTSASLAALTQGVGVSGTDLDVRYTQTGKSVKARVSFTVTSAGTSGQPFQITISGLPQIRATDNHAGTAAYLDNGTQYYVGVAYFSTAGVIQIIPHGGGGFLGSGVAMAVANGDTCVVRLDYEAA